MKKIIFFFLCAALMLNPSYGEESAYKVKSGLSFSQQWGLYVTNIVEHDGKLFGVSIDRISKGKSIKELHDDYGLKKISSLKKELWEQFSFYEKWVSDGKPSDVDVLTGATINVSELADSVSNAEKGIAQINGYKLKTGTSYSPVWGLYIANVIYKDEKISKILIEHFDKNGENSKEKYDSYGLKQISSLQKDWWQQIAYYEEWITKNGVESVKYDKDGKAENVDLLTGATIGVDDLTAAVMNAISK